MKKEIRPSAIMAPGDSDVTPGNINGILNGMVLLVTPCLFNVFRFSKTQLIPLLESNSLTCAKSSNSQICYYGIWHA